MIAVMSARVLPALVAVLTLAAPAVASASRMPRSITGSILHCHQTYASYAPNGRLDHYGESSEWTVRLWNNGPHYDEAYGDGIFEMGAHAGSMTYDKGRMTFTDGPFNVPGWRIVGRFVNGGAHMPHDPTAGRTFPVVLRSATARHNSLAPPRHQRSGRSWFYCG